MKKPTLGEVRAYWTGSNLQGDPEDFYLHFENARWRLSGGKGAPMKDWRLAAQRWSRNEPKFTHGQPPSAGYPDRQEEAAFNKTVVGLSMEAYREAFKQKFGVPLREEKP